MKAETRVALNAMFQAEVDELSDWLGRDLPCWVPSSP